jgi:hypothetical protein
MVEPVEGGVGSIGLPLLDFVHPAEAAQTSTDRAIREIGEWRIRKKNLQLYCRLSSLAFTRMAYSDGGHSVHVLERLRRIATIVSAEAIGIVNVPMPRCDSIVELKPEDRAPDFSCTESDGRTDRLKDLTQRPLVVAWFPNIWTSTKRSAPRPTAATRRQADQPHKLTAPGARPGWSVYGIAGPVPHSVTSQES